MKYLNNFFGILLLFLAAVLIYSFTENFSYKPFIQGLNIVILLFYASYYLFFKKKKEIILSGNRFIVKHGSEKIKEIVWRKGKNCKMSFSNENHFQ